MIGSTTTRRHIYIRDPDIILSLHYKTETCPIAAYPVHRGIKLHLLISPSGYHGRMMRTHGYLRPKEGLSASLSITVSTFD